MSANTVIEVNHVSKMYKLGKVGAATIADDFRNLYLKLSGRKEQIYSKAIANNREQSGGDKVWALEDINFSVQQGDVLGIVGRNGAGKSTLLKILSGITSPTRGEIKIKGRIASLLEVGTGFHPELSGRENIFLNGAILGMNRAEIKSKFDEIVEFSGVAKYIDTPVKRYSSGMRVRLGFAVAAHLEPEILVVDEVLAVGDAEFQAKAIGKMQEVSAKGERTVLFVSHNLSSLRRLCNRGILIESGQLSFQGSINETIEKYLEIGLSGAKKDKGLVKWVSDYPGNEELQLLSVSLSDENFHVKDNFNGNNSIRILVSIKIINEIRNFRLNIQVLTLSDEVVFTTTSHSIEPGNKDKGNYDYIIKLPASFFNRGRYKVRIISDVHKQRLLIHPLDVIEFNILDSENVSTYSLDFLPGITNPFIEWAFEKK